MQVTKNYLPSVTEVATVVSALKLCHDKSLKCKKTLSLMNKTKNYSFLMFKLNNEKRKNPM